MLDTLTDGAFKVVGKLRVVATLRLGTETFEIETLDFMMLEAE